MPALLKLALVDVALTFMAVVVGLMLRLEIIYVGYFIRAIWPFILLDVLLRPLIFYLTGIYKHIWRYAKTRDFLNLAFSVLLGSLVLAPITLFWLYPRWMDTFPRSLLVIEALLSLLFLGAMRVGLKIFEHYPGDKISAEANLAPERALIVGAGSAGTLIVQELRANLQLGLTPVTITHPEMERYFMTIPEAVQLVLQASTLGKNGEVFVLDMGDPVNITDLACDMIELSGYQVGEDIQIEYTGLRPGERLSEALFSQDEKYSRTQHEKIFVARNGLAPSIEDFTHKIQDLERLAKTDRMAELRQKLEELTTPKNKPLS